MYSRAILYLSKDGDKVELIFDNFKEFRPISYGVDNIHPILREAENCDSYEKVLKLLTSIKENTECQKSVVLAHKNNPKYKGHDMFKGVAHEESIDQLIEFVQKRQQDDLELPKNSCSIL